MRDPALQNKLGDPRLTSGLHIHTYIHTYATIHKLHIQTTIPLHTCCAQIHLHTGMPMPHTAGNGCVRQDSPGLQQHPMVLLVWEGTPACCPGSHTAHFLSRLHSRLLFVFSVESANGVLIFIVNCIEFLMFGSLVQGPGL